MSSFVYINKRKKYKRNWFMYELKTTFQSIYKRTSTLAFSEKKKEDLYISLYVYANFSL